MSSTRHTARNSGTRQGTATKERLIADARHAVGDRDARQGVASIERRRADARSTRNHNGFE